MTKAASRKTRTPRTIQPVMMIPPNVCRLSADKHQQTVKRQAGGTKPRQQERNAGQPVVARQLRLGGGFGDDKGRATLWRPGDNDMFLLAPAAGALRQALPECHLLRIASRNIPLTFTDPTVSVCIVAVQSRTVKLEVAQFFRGPLT